MENNENLFPRKISCPQGSAEHKGKNIILFEMRDYSDLIIKCRSCASYVHIWSAGKTAVMK